jgi:TonB family protein
VTLRVLAAFALLAACAHTRKPHLDPAHTAELEACGASIEYPQDALFLRIAGDVVVRVEVGANGVATNVSVMSSPDERLTRALVDGLGRCRFRIAHDSNGKPVPYIIPEYTFHFRER